MTKLVRVTVEEQLAQLERRIRELEFMIEKNPAKFDYDRQILTIGGLDYTCALFEQLGSFLPEGALFQLVARQGGSITLRHVIGELDIRRALKDAQEREAQRVGALALAEQPLDPLHGGPR